MRRRDLFKLLGAAGGTAIAARAARAETAGAVAGSDPVGVLVDTTRCIGCRSCEFACAEANGLPTPAADTVPSPARQTSPEQWTVVQGHEVDGRTITVKRQCLHCQQPACAAACLTKAMHKTPDGPVTWDAGRCMGCRFCMISCPFDVPKFEFHSANPLIQKCQLCAARVAQGRAPACVENCPAQALTFGRRENLLEEARHRIYTAPDTYHHAVYGEREAGGTSWLYLSAVPFDRIGFRTNVSTEPYPAMTKEFLYAVPQVDVLAPLFLLGLARATQRRPRDTDEPGRGGDA